MKKYIHVYNNEIVQRYEAEKPIVYGGPWANGESLEVPAEMELSRVALENGEIIEVPYFKPQYEINAESLAYLASTDWYVTRFIETGITIPEDIKAARQAARESVK